MLEPDRTVRGEVLPLKLREALVVVTNQELTRVDASVVVPPAVEDRIAEGVQRERGPGSTVPRADGEVCGTLAAPGVATGCGLSGPGTTPVPRGRSRAGPCADPRIPDCRVSSARASWGAILRLVRSIGRT